MTPTYAPRTEPRGIDEGAAYLAGWRDRRDGYPEGKRRESLAMLGAGERPWYDRGWNDAARAIENGREIGQSSPPVSAGTTNNARGRGET